MKASEQDSFFQVGQNEYKKSNALIKTENWIKITSNVPTTPRQIQDGWLECDYDSSEFTITHINVMSHIVFLCKSTISGMLVCLPAQLDCLTSKLKFH